MIHPQGLLAFGAQQDLPITEGATVQVDQDAECSALIEEPVEMVRSDLTALVAGGRPETLKPLRQVGLVLGLKDERSERRRTEIWQRVRSGDAGWRQNQVVTGLVLVRLSGP